MQSITKLLSKIKDGSNKPSPEYVTKIVGVTSAQA